MFNFIRGSVYLAVTGNLTYVHHPLRATHGADVASLDRVLGLPTASKCDAVCAERMIANRVVHVVSYSFAKPRPSIRSVRRRRCDTRPSSRSREH